MMASSVVGDHTLVWLDLDLGVVLEEEEANLAHVLDPDVTDAFFILGNESVTATWKQEVVAQVALFHRIVNLATGSLRASNICFCRFNSNFRIILENAFYLFLASSAA